GRGEPRRIEPVVDVLVHCVNGHVWDKIRPLRRSIAIGQRRRGTRYCNVHRQPGPCTGDPGQLPAPEPAVPSLARKLADSIHRNPVPDVDAAFAAVTGAAILILEGHALAGADGSVGDTVAPRVVSLKEQAVNEAAPHGGLQAVEIVVAI